ncbi:MAG: aldolase [Planctomycetes bacterium RBG_16_64_12]|nr:MAG: aldolase [Planctomycetes bacterium RBG_16_64_12]
MNTGKLVRLNRLFSDPSGRLCSVAVDHFIGYAEGLPDGLREIGPTLAAIVAAKPDAVTMHKGIAASAWQPHAGLVPMILQSTIARPDDSACEQIATPEDAVRLGADAFAVAAFVRGPTEAAHLRTVADSVRRAARFEIPVVVHVYPRNPDNSTISFEPEDIAWAVRCALETGVDVIKAPYCGNLEAHRQIVSDCPLPVVAAGGPRAQTLESALTMIREVVQSGARGATIGRNVWGFAKITAAIEAFKAVIHDGKSDAEALASAGL